MTTLSNLEPYQQEFAKRLMATTETKNRFQLVPGIMNYGSKYEGLGSYGLMICDFAWWMDNERDILNWLVDALPQGIDHQTGMFVYFPTEQDRVMFLLRWA